MSTCTDPTPGLSRVRSDRGRKVHRGTVRGGPDCRTAYYRRTSTAQRPVKYHAVAAPIDCALCLRALAISVVMATGNPERIPSLDLPADSVSRSRLVNYLVETGYLAGQPGAWTLAK